MIDKSIPTSVRRFSARSNQDTLPSFTLPTLWSLLAAVKIKMVTAINAKFEASKGSPWANGDGSATINLLYSLNKTLTKVYMHT